jgi:hypothetical protein
LEAARQNRKERRRGHACREQMSVNSHARLSPSGRKPNLTKSRPFVIITSAGKTEAGSAGEQPARDNRSGYDEYSSRGVHATPRPLSGEC